MVKEYIKELIDKWKVHRLLKRSGCKTIEQYNHVYDPLINRRTDTVSAFYYGYPYVVRIPYYTGDWYEGIEQLTRWCDRYCKEKWRHDWHRVRMEFHQNGAISYVTDEINGIIGGDFMYFAFICQKDYNWFILSHNLND